jgi:two-component system response regulator ChvI
MLTQAEGSARHVLLVDDDEQFLKAFGANLAVAGYVVTRFSSPSAALGWLTSGGAAEIAVFDWNMPEMDGAELLGAVRRAGLNVPVMFLTSLREPVFEELGLMQGAVDFVDKTKSPSIILKRLEIILGMGKGGSSAPTMTEATGSFDCGELELRVEIKRALWRGAEVKLSLGEFQLVWLLVNRGGDDVSYRELYDHIRGDGFIAGAGDEGYRANVRAMVKRIRGKFCEVDPNFNALENYAGFGYRWRIPR